MKKSLSKGILFLAASLTVRASDQWGSELEQKMLRDLSRSDAAIPELFDNLYLLFPDAVRTISPEEKQRKTAQDIYHQLNAAISECKSVLESLKHDHEDGFQITQSLIPILQKIKPFE